MRIAMSSGAAAVLVAVVCAAAHAKTVYVKVLVDSEARGYEGVNALDGNPNTLWHTEWQNTSPRHPHEIVVDLGAVYEITGVEYLPRSDGAANGSIREYELYVGRSEADFGPAVARGTFRRVQSANSVRLPQKTEGRYVKLVARSEVNGNPWTSIAELQVLAEGVTFRTQTAPTAVVRGSSGPRPARRPAATQPKPDVDTVDGALEFARRTLAFVEDAAPRPELAAELASLEKRAEQQAAGPGTDQAALIEEIRRLRRQIMLSHPLLDFARLLINKRPPPGFSHQSDQYLGRYSGPGAGLVVLDDWKGEPRETVLLDGKLPPGSVLHPDLSFDAERILFSYCDHTEPNPELRRFFIWEIGVDGSGLRQVTGTAADPMEGQEGRATVLIEDFDPCYLPDGGIAFISTRNQGGVRCHHGGRYCPTYTLYRCEADGSRLRPMVYGEANEWDPSVLHDGRIIWTRWDYINRHDTVYQSLWTLRPDGTGTAHFYGNYTRNPCSIAEARAIPDSQRVVATATAHHSYTAGSIIVIDPLAGQDGAEPLERITPEVCFPETEGWATGAFATPWPLSEDLFLAAHTPDHHAKQGGQQARNAYAIYLIDTLGGRELIYRDPEVSCFAPTPIVPRPVPPVLPSMVAGAYQDSEWSAGEPESGVYYVQDVYESTEAIPAGSIKSLRVVRMYPQTTIRVPDRSQVLFETAKRVLGTVPVADDGSVAFRAPAAEPLMFQLLDEHGMAVMSMRTFVYLHPGEQATCVGCHEPRHSSPQPAAIPPGVRIRGITPPVGPRYEGGLSFVRAVQPVLDRYCISCHGLERTDGDVNLLGTMDPGPVNLGNVRANAAYHTLAKLPGMVVVAHRNRETPYSKPMDYFSHAGRLAGLLLAGHPDRDGNHQAVLDPVSFRRVVQWLDLNGEFYGDYSWNKPEWREISPVDEKALRDHVRKTFGPELAEQPFAALVNVGLATESRILKAPLAVGAGGWGQIAGGWASTSEPGYRKMLELVEASLRPVEYHDVAGTCQRPNCECRSCWVHAARQEWKRQHAPAVADVGTE